MSNNSVLQNNIKNQQDSSWNDDPFDLKGAINGVTSLSHSRNLYFYAEDLVQRYALFDGECYNVTFLNLPEHEQNELARLYLEYTDREISECIHGQDFSIDNEFTCKLLAMLKNDCKHAREAFAETTRKNVITYFEKDLQRFLDDCCHEMLCNQNNEQGFYAQQCKDTGETVWSKY